MKLNKRHFASLVETRVILEVNSARLAAERRTPSDIIAIKNSMNAFEEKAFSGRLAVEEDLLIHLKIAKASKNPMLNSLMLIITPYIVTSFIELEVCSIEQNAKVKEDHQMILQHIVDQNGEEASNWMRMHLQDVINFSQSL